MDLFFFSLSRVLKVSIPTTLNSAGCDREKMEEMGIDYPDFLKFQFDIIEAYNNAWNSGTSLLSSFIFSLKDKNVQPNFELIKSPTAFYSPKIGKTYQTNYNIESSILIKVK